MKGDFSRVHDERPKHYSGVLMQQGRLLLDADFNTHVDLEGKLREIVTLDVIGRTGAPRDHAGFRISKHPNGQDLFISAGRMYVDGILCECEGALTRVVSVRRVGAAAESSPARSTGVAEAIDITHGSPIAAITVDEWSYQFADEGWVELTTSQFFQPGVNRNFHRIATADAATKTLTFNPPLTGIGTVHYAQAAILWSKQPDIPVAPELPDYPYLVYLDVWQRHITALEDPLIRESALGGPDTTTRVKTVWQVRVKDHEPCNTFAPASGDARMAARTKLVLTTATPCEIPEAAGYRRLENQLYRVEVHTPGDANTATFKWSRDNGAIVFAIEVDPNLAASKLKLKSIGLDDRTQLHDDDWVEVFDDLHELEGLPGVIMRVKTPPEAATRVVELTSNLPANTIDAARNPRLRVWSRPDAAAGDQKVSTTGYVDLEDGIEVKFSGNDFRTGDYWLIPARTAISTETGNIEWPATGTPPVPSFLRPRGITHHYAPLAEVYEDRVEDCRAIFAPATAPDLFYLGGDAQEAPLDKGTGFIPLELPLLAGVSNGTPVAGAQVRFSIDAPGGGGLVVAGQPESASVVCTTDATGIASCQWKINRDDEVQIVRAEIIALESPGFVPSVQPIVYHARLRTAKSVYYDPSKCRGMNPGIDNVQDAIDALCARPTGGGVCTITIKEGDDVRARFNEVVGERYVEICFGTGEFPVDDFLPLADHESVKITGAGAGTVLTGNRATVLHFYACTSVLVRDMVVNAGNHESSASPEAALRFEECADIKIENVDSRSGANDEPGTRSCLAAGRSAVINVRRCRMEVSRYQYGTLLFEPEAVILEENRIHAERISRGTGKDADVITSRAARAPVIPGVVIPPIVPPVSPAIDVSKMFRDYNIVKGVDPKAPGNIHIPVGGFQIGLTTTDEIGRDLKALMTERAAEAKATVQEERQVTPFANRILQEIVFDPLRRLTFRFLYEFLTGAVVLPGPAIVRPVDRGAGIAILVSRGTVGRITIRDNEIDGMHTAINVGMMPKAGKDEGGSIDRAVIQTNQINGKVDDGLLAGICVGSCASLLVDGNRVLLAERLESSRGILVNGVLGPFAIISDNEVVRWAVGIHVTPQSTPPVKPLWRLIGNNVRQSSIMPWDVPKEFVEDGNIAS